MNVTTRSLDTSNFVKERHLSEISHKEQVQKSYGKIADSDQIRFGKSIELGPAWRKTMSWQQSQIQLRDRSAHVTIDGRFESSAPIPELPILNWFGVWFVGEAAPDEFVPKGDEEEFQRVEAMLIEASVRRANGWAVYCFRLISQGIAEYYLYSRDEDTASGVVKDLEKAFPGRRFDHETRADAKWSEYEKYLEAI